MAAERREMWSVLEVLRLKIEGGQSDRAVARSVGMARSTVADYLARFRASGLAWPLPPGMDEAALEGRLFPRDSGLANVVPDWSFINVELRHKGVTLALLWQEYAREHGKSAYQYSRFCELYGLWRCSQRLSMRQVHRVGHKLFVDFSGDPLFVVDVRTGERKPVRLFVATQGASSMTFACALPDETQASWVEGMTQAVEFFGGSTEVVVPDNPRALVTRANRHDPVLTEGAMEWASHYNTCIMPARPYRPKDKAKVEVAVQVAQRWIGAVLRNRVFNSLVELNKAIAPLLEGLNNRVMRHTGQSRSQMFEALDKPALRPLPHNRHQHASWHTARVHPDYHVQLERNLYSVPYIHRGEVVRSKVYGATVEIQLAGKCIATHVRALGQFQRVTLPEHMPPAHRAMEQGSSVENVLLRAKELGASVHIFCKELTLRARYPEYAIRGIQGVLDLRHTYPANRMEAACARALRLRTLEARAIRSILKAGLDQVVVPPPVEDVMTASHEAGLSHMRSFDGGHCHKRCGGPPCHAAKGWVTSSPLEA